MTDIFCSHRSSGQSYRTIIQVTLCLVILTFNQKANAQWQHVGFTNWSEVTIEHNYSLFVISGDQLFSSTDFGSHWDSLGFPTTFIPYSAMAGVGDTLLIGSSWIIFPEDTTPVPSVSRSQDGGKTWTTVLSSVGGVSSIVRCDQYFYTNPGLQLYRSEDGGLTWSHILSDSALARSVQRLYARDGILYAANDENQLFYSTDNALTWTMMNNGWGSPWIYEMAGSRDTFFIGTSHGVYRTTDEGISWLKFSPGDHIIFDLLVSGNRVVAVWDDSVYASPTDVPVWENISSGLPSSSIHGLATCGPFLFTGTGEGVWRYALQDSLLRFISIEVTEGWNLLSLPARMSDPRKAVLFPTAASDAFTYSSQYLVSDTIGQGYGYWVKFETEQSPPVLGIPSTTGTIGVHPGWNMIGSVSSPVAVSDITSDPPGLVTSEFFGYQDSYKAIDSIMPGKGYWVKATTAGKLTLDASGGMLAKGSGGRIRIVPTDELPPSPPPPNGEVVMPEPPMPHRYGMSQNYPNPFNPSTSIAYQVPGPGHVTLKVYDLLGREIATLIDEVKPVGEYTVRWDASNRPSGAYYYRLQAGNYTATKMMMLVK